MALALEIQYGLGDLEILGDNLVQVIIGLVMESYRLLSPQRFAVWQHFLCINKRFNSIIKVIEKQLFLYEWERVKSHRLWIETMISFFLDITKTSEITKTLSTIIDYPIEVLVEIAHVYSRVEEDLYWIKSPYRGLEYHAEVGCFYALTEDDTSDDADFWNLIGLKEVNDYNHLLFELGIERQNSRWTSNVITRIVHQFERHLRFPRTKVTSDPSRGLVIVTITKETLHYTVGIILLFGDKAKGLEFKRRKILYNTLST
jgi:hypothetical protein